MSTQPTVIEQKWGALDILVKGLDGLLEAAAEVLTADVRQRIKNGSRSGRMYYKPGTKFTSAGRKSGMFTSIKTGKTYGVTRSGKRLMYQASAAGEVPAVATGSMLKYVGRGKAFRTGPHSWAVDVGNRAHSGGVSYPAVLMAVNRGKSKIARRSPVYEESLNSAAVQQKIIDLWKRR